MPIALLTDFGTGSVYVGQLKGAIARRAPSVPTIDLTHEVEPQAVDEAAFLLAGAVPHFPEETVFLAVVDPGVGSAREILIVSCGGGRLFVAPDNGLLGLVLERAPDARAWHVGRALYASAAATFHGRDIMAPVAARLAAGEPPDALGLPVPVGALALYPAPRPRWEGRAVCRGRVVHIDRFGNLVSDVAPPGGGIASVRAVRTAGREVRAVARTYAEAAPGTPFAYVGSFGTLEIGVPGASAKRALGAARGQSFETFFVNPEEVEG